MQLNNFKIVWSFWIFLLFGSTQAAFSLGLITLQYQGKTLLSTLSHWIGRFLVSLVWIATIPGPLSVPSTFPFNALRWLVLSMNLSTGIHWSALLNSQGRPSADLWDSLCCYLVSISELWTLAVLFSLVSQLLHFPLVLPWPVSSLKVISWGKSCSFPISEAVSFIAWYPSWKLLFYIFCLVSFCCCRFRWESKYGPCYYILARFRSSPKALILIVTSHF